MLLELALPMKGSGDGSGDVGCYVAFFTPGDNVFSLKIYGLIPKSD